MNNIPLVSVIIPLYNRELLIVQTINSLISQDYENWEAIIVDDGSTDNSIEVVKEISNTDKRINLYKRNTTPKGAPTCRNIGIEKAKGEYMIFLDSDDLLAPYCIEQRINCFKENSENDFLVFYALFFKELPGDSNSLWNIHKQENDLDRFLFSDIPWHTSSPIWKTSYLKNSFTFDEAALNYQDWEFHTRILMTNPSYKKIDVMPDCFIRRDNKLRISNFGGAKNHINSRKNTMIKIYKLLEKNKIANKSRKKAIAAFIFRDAEQLNISRSSISDVISLCSIIKTEKLTSKGLYLSVLIFLILENIFYPINIVFRIVRKTALLLLPKQIFDVETASYKRISDNQFIELNKYWLQ